MRGRRDPPAVAMPNPFYQIYEGAALLAGAEPVFLNTTRRRTFPAGSRRAAGGDLEALPAAVPVQPGQSHRRGAVARFPAVTRSSLPNAMTSSSPATSVTRSCIATSTRHRPRCCRRRCARDAIDSNAAWCFIPCRSARACPACAPASSPAIRPRSSATCSIAPIMAAPCRSQRSSPASPPGVTMRMPRRTGRCTARNSRRVIPILAPLLDAGRTRRRLLSVARRAARR